MLIEPRKPSDIVTLVIYEFVIKSQGHPPFSFNYGTILCSSKICQIDWYYIVVILCYSLSLFS